MDREAEEEDRQERSSRRKLRPGGVALLVLLIFLLALGALLYLMNMTAHNQLLRSLALGWIDFLARTIPKMEFNLSIAGMAVGGISHQIGWMVGNSETSHNHSPLEADQAYLILNEQDKENWVGMLTFPGIDHPYRPWVGILELQLDTHPLTLNQTESHKLIALRQSLC